MISVILTLYNRAHLLKWCLEAIYRNTFPEDKKLIEINVLDDGSTDGLDDLLQKESERFGQVNKYVWDKSKLEVPIKFNCPAQALNLLVKLANHPVIYKTDPEIVILDKNFIEKAVTILESRKEAIIMPFPYHCFEFPIQQFEDIENNYLQNYYPTHITRENIQWQAIYYQGVWEKETYKKLGGIDERFSSSIGSEDNDFLDKWKRQYGEGSSVSLLDSPVVHLYHGGFAQPPRDGVPRGVPVEFYSWVEEGVKLKEQLKNVMPNEGREWGRIPEGLTLTRWEDGVIVCDKEVYR